jgi:hypothetical protein
MANVSIALTPLVINTRSNDLIASGTSVPINDTFDIDAKGKTDDLIIFLESTDANAPVVTFNAGVDPPSKREGLGNLAVNLATLDARILQLEGGRFIQANGKITGSVATGITRITAFRTSRRW